MQTTVRSPPAVAPVTDHEKSGSILPCATLNLSLLFSYAAGYAVMWGLGNKARSAAECCQKCRDFKPSNKDVPHGCQIWIWCGEYCHLFLVDEDHELFGTSQGKHYEQ
jgi:hypothetical protein